MNGWVDGVDKKIRKIKKKGGKWFEKANNWVSTQTFNEFIVNTLQV